MEEWCASFSPVFTPECRVLVLGSGESGLVLSKPEVLDRVAQQILEDMGRNEEK